MEYTPNRKPLYEVSAKLAKVALGKESADLVIKGGRLVNVHSQEILEHMDVAITAGRIAFVGQADHTIGPNTQIIEAQGRYIVPGLLDAHMHVESTMLTVTEFSKAALMQGTTGIFMDPHEIANVFGLPGVKLMHEEGQQLPLKVYTTIPSCVPATDHLEDAGATLQVEDIEEGLAWEAVAGLGEVMNFPGVVYGDPKMAGEIKATIQAGKTVTGHFPPEDDKMLQAYIASGVTSCHETVTREQGLAKARLGMHVMIREGSAWHDVKEVIKIVTEDKVNTSNILLVTDDVYPHTLVHQGHLNHVVRRAIEEGVDPITAIQMATINVARYYRLENDLGSITPGKVADLLLIDDLEQMKPSTIITDGTLIIDQGNWQVTLPTFEYPTEIKQSVKLQRPIVPSDFQIKSRYADTGETKVRVIQAIENSARTGSFTAQLKVENGFIQHDLEQDILRLACIERHKASGQISLAFASGFKLKTGAVASTVAHDSHNLLVMGTNEEDMALAVNTLAECGGGMVVVDQGEVKALVPMAVAGLMSDKTLDQVVQEVSLLEKAWKDLGCTIHAPFMTFSLIALPVIPDMRISNRGLVDVTTFELVDVEIKE